MWTDEVFERAKTLWLAGKSASEVAAQVKAELGVAFSRNAIVGKMHRTGNHRPDERPSRNPRRARTPRPDGPQAPKPVAVKHKPATPSLRLSILDLSRKQCRFGTHETDDRQHQFCGHETAEGSSYCQAHRAVIIDRKRTDSARRKKKRRTDPDIAALRTAQLNAGLTRIFG